MKLAFTPILFYEYQFQYPVEGACDAGDNIRGYGNDSGDNNGVLRTLTEKITRGWQLRIH